MDSSATQQSGKSHTEETDMEISTLDKLTVDDPPGTMKCVKKDEIVEKVVYLMFRCFLCFIYVLSRVYVISSSIGSFLHGFGCTATLLRLFNASVGTFST